MKNSSSQGQKAEQSPQINEIQDKPNDFEQDLVNQYGTDIDDQKAHEQIVEESPRRRFLRFNEEIGQGAFKTVYKGYDSDTGCEIA